jgi:hypothetical protein
MVIIQVILVIIQVILPMKKTVKPAWFQIIVFWITKLGVHAPLFHFFLRTNHLEFQIEFIRLQNQNLYYHYHYHSSSTQHLSKVVVARSCLLYHSQLFRLYSK